MHLTHIINDDESNLMNTRFHPFVFRITVPMSNILLQFTDHTIEYQPSTNKPLYVLYHIKCSYRTNHNSTISSYPTRANQESYTVIKRYSELLELHKKIMKQLGKRSSSSSNSPRKEKHGSSPSATLQEEGIKFPGKLLFGNFKVSDIRVILCQFVMFYYCTEYFNVI